jgi:hypothetical protein
MITKNFRHIFAAFSVGCGLAATLASCNEEPTYFQLDTYPDQMHLEVSQSEIVFNKGIANQTALTFTWQKAVSPINSTDSVTYKMAFYDTNQKTDNHSDYFELGDVTSASFTHDELNSIISRWVIPGQPLQVTAQLLAIVHNAEKYVKPIQSTVNFTATCYEKYPTYMYLRYTDDATQTTKTEKMEQRQMGTGIYEVTLNLEPCHFYFLTTLEDYPAYGMAANQPEQPGIYKMEYVTSGDVTEFSTTEYGRRTIVIDTNAEENNYRMYLPLPSSTMPWMGGNATDIGWVENDPAGRFTQPDKLHAPYIYTWTGNIIAGGEFKIGVGARWGDQFFYAPSANTDPFANSTLLPYRSEGDGGDLKWVPTKSGAFTVTLSLLIGDMYIKLN